MAAKIKNWGAIRKINEARAARKANRKNEAQGRCQGYIAMRGMILGGMGVDGVRYGTLEAEFTERYKLICGWTRKQKVKALKDGEVCFSELSDAALWARGEL